MTSFFNAFWGVPREQAELVLRNQPESVREGPEVKLHWERTSPPKGVTRRDLPDFLFYELKSIEIEQSGP